MEDTKKEYIKYLNELKVIVDTIPKHIANTIENRTKIMYAIDKGEELPFAIDLNVFQLTHNIMEDVFTHTNKTPEVITTELVDDIIFTLPRDYTVLLSTYNSTNQRVRQFYYKEIKKVKKIIHEWNKNKE